MEYMQIYIYFFNIWNNSLHSILCLYFWRSFGSDQTGRTHAVLRSQMVGPLVLHSWCQQLFHSKLHISRVPVRRGKPPLQTKHSHFGLVSSVSPIKTVFIKFHEKPADMSIDHSMLLVSPYGKGEDIFIDAFTYFIYIKSMSFHYYNELLWSYWCGGHATCCVRIWKMANLLKCMFSWFCICIFYFYWPVWKKS